MKLDTLSRSCNNLIVNGFKILLVIVVVIAILGGSYYLGLSGKVNLNSSPKSAAITTINPEPEIPYIPEVTATPTPVNN
jgi:uncharacterized protein (UPF0333 family)